MTTYGYIWRERELEVDFRYPYDCSTVNSFTEHIIDRNRRHWEQHYAYLDEDRLMLEPYVDRVVHIACPVQHRSWSDFVRTILPGDKAVVIGYHVLAAKPHRQVELLREAQEQRILVISLKETALLQLDIDVALELHRQWVLDPLASTVQEDTNTTYLRLKELMLEGYTGDKIAAAMGVSRSTVFRLRREFHDRLVDDVPGYG